MDNNNSNQGKMPVNEFVSVLRQFLQNANSSTGSSGNNSRFENSIVEQRKDQIDREYNEQIKQLKHRALAEIVDTFERLQRDHEQMQKMYVFGEVRDMLGNNGNDSETVEAFSKFLLDNVGRAQKK